MMKKLLLIMLIIAGVFTTPAMKFAFGSNRYADQQQKKEVSSHNAVKVIYVCPMHPEEISDKPGKCPKCGMNLVKKEVAKVVYVCPMHPEEISDKPGKCPKCGMNLVLKVPENKEQTKKSMKAM
jgi:hypothetical protein